jgi:hypothetical protein
MQPAERHFFKLVATKRRTLRMLAKRTRQKLAKTSFFHTQLRFFARACFTRRATLFSRVAVSARHLDFLNV